MAERGGPKAGARTQSWHAGQRKRQSPQLATYLEQLLPTKQAHNAYLRTRTVKSASCAEHLPARLPFAVPGTPSFPATKFSYMSRLCAYRDPGMQKTEHTVPGGGERTLLEESGSCHGAFAAGLVVNRRVLHPRRTCHPAPRGGMRCCWLCKLTPHTNAQVQIYSKQPILKHMLHHESARESGESECVCLFMLRAQDRDTQTVGMRGGGNLVLGSSSCRVSTPSTAGFVTGCS